MEKWIKGNEVPRPNVYVLRNAEEGNAIYEACKGKRVAIVGSSFIGVETAAAVVGIASSVVVIGMEQVPFERVLGLEVGGMLQKVHSSHDGHGSFVLNCLGHSGSTNQTQSTLPLGIVLILFLAS